jgi:hypothetical protein
MQGRSRLPWSGGLLAVAVAGGRGGGRSCAGHHAAGRVARPGRPAILPFGMRRGSMVLATGVLALVGVGSASGAPRAPTGAATVRVLDRIGVHRNVHLAFQPTGVLPAGGYYYAVLVLAPYRRYTRQNPPRCATSSDMLRTDYGYPHPGQPVRLTLTPASSPAGHWCPGGTYFGGIYAVPHPPPCESRYPCRSEPYKPPSPCWELKPASGYAGRSHSPGAGPTRKGCRGRSTLARGSSRTSTSSSSQPTTRQPGGRIDLREPGANTSIPAITNP